MLSKIKSDRNLYYVVILSLVVLCVGIYKVCNFCGFVDESHTPQEQEEYQHQDIGDLVCLFPQKATVPYFPNQSDARNLGYEKAISVINRAIAIAEIYNEPYHYTTEELTTSFYSSGTFAQKSGMAMFIEDPYLLAIKLRGLPVDQKKIAPVERYGWDSGFMHPYYISALTKDQNLTDPTTKEFITGYRLGIKKLVEDTNKKAPRDRTWVEACIIDYSEYLAGK